MKEKKRGNIKLILLFFIIAIILVLAGVFLFLKGRTQTSLVEETKPDFKVDQILIKVLIKNDERMVKPVNIMDISEEALTIEIEPQYLLDIVTVSDNNFTLKPGQTKTVYINFSTSIEENGIRQEPGVYVGSLLIKSNSYMIRTPVIVEIETKDVLFDANVEVPIWQKQIKQGDYLRVQIALFNLKKIGLTNLNMDYFVKDIAGNTIITETESITVETRTSFVKTIYIPENLNPGEYIFGAVTRYGSSVGTSTFLFEVIKPVVKEENLLDYCRKNRFCRIVLVILAIIIVVIGSYMIFLIGTFIQGEVIRPFEPVKKKEEKKLVKKEIKPKAEFKYKKLVLVLLIIFAFITIIAYLFYSKVITLEKLAHLWNLAINWLKNLGEKIPYYTSPQRRYFYHIVRTIIGLMVLISFIIIAEKRDLFEKFKEFVKKHKILFILGIIIACCIAFGILFYQGIITTAQIKEWINNIVNSIQTGWQKVVCLVGIIAIGIISYLKRKDIRYI